MDTDEAERARKSLLSVVPAMAEFVVNVDGDEDFDFDEYKENFREKLSRMSVDELMVERDDFRMACRWRVRDGVVLVEPGRRRV